MGQLARKACYSLPRYCSRLVALHLLTHKWNPHLRISREWRTLVVYAFKCSILWFLHDLRTQLTHLYRFSFYIHGTGDCGTTYPQVLCQLLVVQ